MRSGVVKMVDKVAPNDAEKKRRTAEDARGVANDKGEAAEQERIQNELRRMASESDRQTAERLRALEQTIRYMRHKRLFLTGNRDRKGRKEFLELNQLHELARVQVFGAEIQVRNENPTRH
jgi:erythromycin esterase-like protein